MNQPQKSKKNKKEDKLANEDEKSFSAAIRAAKSSPGNEENWDTLEDLADSLQRPEEVATLYREVLSPKLPKKLRSQLFERAINYHEEWFGDNPQAMNSVLSRIIEIEPEATWAFERLTVVLTAAEQWDDLLAVYDRTLASAKDQAHLKQLLDDAAHVAKDFAQDLNRSANYLKRLFELDPTDSQLASSTERLLERLERWTDLVEFWRARIAALSTDEAQAIRMQIVNCCLDNLHDPVQALDELNILLSNSPCDVDGCRALERLLMFENAPQELRLKVLDLLKTNYDAAKNPEAAVAAVEKAIEFVESSEKVSLYREAGMRLAMLGKDTDAIEHYGKLLIEEPGAPDVRKQIRLLAARSENWNLHAEALVAAADVCSETALKVALLVEAAYLHWDSLKDPNTAIDLFSTVLSTEDIEQSVALTAAHNLNELLAAADHNEKRLKVLERLADLERTNVTRKTVLGEAAGLAEELGDTDKALVFWQIRLDADIYDLEALTAVVNLLEHNRRWKELITALNHRSKAPVLSEQRRADLSRIAEIQTSELEKFGDAIDTWFEILTEFGPHPDILLALNGLLAIEGRWNELATLLEGAADTEYERATSLLSRLGDIHFTELDQIEKATSLFIRTLALNPSHEETRTGLKALLDREDAPPKAAEALASAYSSTDDWQLCLDILEPRLKAARSDFERARILVEAAELQEKRAEDPAAALGSLTRAFPIAPTDAVIERDLMRLAEATDKWEDAAKAYSETARVVSDLPARMTELRFTEGHILENKLNDLEGALAAYSAVAECDPSSTRALHSLVRVASRSGRWEKAVQSAIASASACERFETPVIEQLESAALDNSAWDNLTEAMTQTLSERDDLPADLVRDFETKIVLWHRDRRNDVDAAEAVARSAAKHDPTHLDTQFLLASLQRRAPGPALIESLLCIDELTNRNLDAINEAARVAIETNHEYETKRSIVIRLYQKASRLWDLSEQAIGEHTAQASTNWAIEEITRLDFEANRPDRAVKLLLDGAMLPFDAETSRSMRMRAADILIDQGQRGRAIELYSRVLEETPKDLELMRRLESLMEQEERIPELLILLRKELKLIEESERKLELRLSISRLVGMVEGSDERVESLSANLEEEPGHPASIDAICAILHEKASHSVLADLLSDQARKLEELDKTDRGVVLWALVADLADKFLGDSERAIFAHTRIVELKCNNDSLDALARLCLHRGTPQEAATWLRRRLLDTKDPLERVAVMLSLAKAQIQATQPDRAIATLETAFDEAPRNAEVRKLLTNQYRSSEAWEPLARTLSKATEHIVDETTILAYAREAADIYNTTLGTPDRAISVLERALPLASEDRSLRSMLANGLWIAKRLDEASELAVGLLEDFGRRRSSERAAVHLLLARIVRDQGNMDEALEQLELASKMDNQNVVIWQTLAELARESGQLEKAERAYRTLLLIVRRGQQGPEDDVRVGSSEVLIELSRIAADQGQSDQADELCESAFEALSKDDSEAPKLQSKLIEWNRLDLLERAFETRLEHLEKPRLIAKVMSEYADLLEGPLERPENALDMRIRAVESDPGSPVLHDAAHELAVKTEQINKYIEKLETLFENTRRDSDVHARCELLLRLGKSMETEREDLDRAREYYALAENTGVREVDVWRALARVSGALGDTSEQMRLLTNLSSLGEEEVETETRADVLYRLAEIQLASEETRAEGVESLKRALSENTRNVRAGRILRRACEASEPDDKMLALYEQVAREAGDEQMFLDYLERNAAHADATPEQIREGCDLATKLDEPERAEALMLRAVEIGRDTLESADRIAWALMGLAIQRKEADNLADSIKWLIEASEVADPAEVFALARELSALAAEPDGDVNLAIMLYERLFDRDPTARDAWEPLAEIYTNMGDVERLERLSEEVLSSLMEPGDRNTLRLKQGKLLLATPERESEAVDVFKDVLLEDPENAEASTLLAEYFERSGNLDELITMIREQFLGSVERQEIKVIKVTALKLVNYLQDKQPDEAIAVYRKALEFAVDDRELLQGLLKCLGTENHPAECAEIMEQILKNEEDESAVSYAIEAADIYKALNDDTGALRVLDLGYRRAPANDTIRNSLMDIYKDRGDDAGLARMLVQIANGQSDTATRIATLKEAVIVYRDRLSDSRTALEIMSEIVEQDPDDMTHRIEFAKTLASTGERSKAIEQLTSLLNSIDDDKNRLDLLRMRAEMRSATGDEKGAIADLEEAFSQAPEAVATDIESAFQRRKAMAANVGDRETERAAILRLAEIMLAQDKSIAACDVLEEWIDKEPEDTEMIQMALDLHTDGERWDDTARVCAKLVELRDGEAQIETVLRLAEACRLSGKPEDAKAQLEQIHSTQPKNRHIRNELAKIYEQVGAKKELATLIIDDAWTTEDKAARAALLQRAGVLFWSVGEIGEAKPALEAALALVPGDAQTIAALADIRIADGALGEASELLEAAIKACKGHRTPELCLLQKRKAQIARAEGNTEEELKCLKQATLCDRTDGDVAVELASRAEELEEWDMAVWALKTIALMKADAPISRAEVFLRQGRISLHRGDERRAMLFARQAQQEDPNLEEVAVFLNELGEK
ncbi:MAG: hypothetical protein GY847_05025 [Proteobacteria bacterium]|nr:hypothetical protein [Pseudomonadota bacterium]